MGKHGASSERMGMPAYSDFTDQATGRHKTVAENTEQRLGRHGAPRNRNVMPKSRKRTIMAFRNLGVASFAAIMLIGMVVGALFFARPAVSQVERRDLTAFPAITIPSFLDGSFFSDVSLWFADTYPLREQLVSFDQAFVGLYGINGGPMMVGGNVRADELPTDGQQLDTSEAPNQPEVIEVPDAQELQAEMQNQIMNGLYVDGGAAYSMYYFSQEAVQAFANAINTAATNLAGVSQVYSVLVPNNSGAILDEDVLKSLGGTDQEQAIKYFFSLYNDDIITVNPLENLRNHRDEYIYFRTDHHWTQLGAYYAYEVFCREAGLQPSDYWNEQTITFEPFLGTVYTELGLAAMQNNPDYVEAHIPQGTNDMTYWSDGVEYEGNVVNDVTGWARGTQYSTFILGDQPLSRIENPAVTDGSSALLIKDSYGCAFAPLLVDNYQTLYIIDYRAYDGDIVDFAKEHQIQDVIFLDNISMAGTLGTANTILSKVQGS